MKNPQILVCGAGPMGRRHIANLRTLGARVTVWRARPELAGELAAELGLPVETDLEVGIGEADGVVVANATEKHVEIALAAANAGRALFIEPPLAPSREGLDPLLGTCAGLGLVVEIGCQRRLHPTLRALKAMLTDPTDGPVLGYDIRVGEQAGDEPGENVLFGAIHAIDLALWLFGPIDSVAGEARGDDLASLSVQATGGVIGQIVIDRLSPVPRCTVEVLRKTSILRWTLADGRLTRETAAGVAPVTALVPGWTAARMQLEHMRHFVRRVADPAIPHIAPLEDATAAIEVAMAGRRAARYGRRVLMTEPPE